jgi:hypothetical protein
LKHRKLLLTRIDCRKLGREALTGGRQPVRWNAELA